MMDASWFGMGGRWCSVAGSVRPPAGTGTDATAVYALGSSHGESARLQRQADELSRHSAALLDRVGLAPGHSAIDLGCGPRGILDLLAGRVSPGGRLSAWTLTRRTPPWRPSSPPGARLAVWKS
jgi:predicted methyltransferase